MNKNQSIYNCSHCGGVLGVSSGDVLIIGSVKIKQPIRLVCSGCGRASVWRPSVQKSENASLSPAA